MANRYERAVQGEEISNFFGNRVVLSRGSRGRVVAVKQKPRDFFVRSEGDMMDFASKSHAEIRVPGVLGCYDILPDISVMVSDLVPGVRLDKVWPSMNQDQRDSIKVQLKEQVHLFRTCTQPFIGRVNRQPVRNSYDRAQFRFMGPFDSELEFDKWCLSRLKSPVAKLKWKLVLSKLRPKSPRSSFVLTHGDLAARNIIVNDGRITGIVDWEHSGFFPDYMEYAAAMSIGNHEDWWQAVLAEILEPCETQRLEFSTAIKIW